MGVELQALGAGFMNLFQSVISVSWPTEFFQTVLGIEGEMAEKIAPILLAIYLAIYLVCLISCLTMRSFQKKTSIFSWKQKVPNFILTLLPFMTIHLLTGTCSEMGAAAAGIEGTMEFSLNGLYFLGSVIGTVGWWRILLVLLFIWTLIHPLKQLWKCIRTYRPASVGILWTVYDLGLGLACMSSILLAMYCGNYALYIIAPVLISMNWLGEKPKQQQKEAAVES